MRNIQRTRNLPLQELWLNENSSKELFGVKFRSIHIIRGLVFGSRSCFCWKTGGINSNENRIKFSLMYSIRMFKMLLMMARWCWRETCRKISVSIFIISSRIHSIYECLHMGWWKEMMKRTFSERIFWQFRFLESYTSSSVLRFFGLVGMFCTTIGVAFPATYIVVATFIVICVIFSVRLAGFAYENDHISSPASVHTLSGVTYWVL